LFFLIQGLTRQKRFQNPWTAMLTGGLTLTPMLTPMLTLMLMLVLTPMLMLMLVLMLMMLPPTTSAQMLLMPL